ncbi:MAG: sterol desaturase [Limisphaerales bacterium]|nr:MAG: sterol desaturase [Limisphaerales bacterium]KAG0506698.1 MAG: sterol desaturase [Limisphaerales bacterium]TXT47667.1 MAG: sterol desaturase [Limisphaerales bacterium]
MEAFLRASLAMTDELLSHEPMLRLGVFLGLFVLMSVWELLAARRERPVARLPRWPGNLGVSFLDAFLARLVAPAGAVGFALLVEARGLGLFHSVDWPVPLEVVAAIVVLDCAIYWQHRLFHLVPALWRLHRMHHADLDVDVTTGARFHPVEILLSLGVKCLVIAALGAPAVSVLVFEVLLNATSMFNHSNVRVPTALERVLRCFVITPDLHRVHHSVLRHETDSNFGFNLPWWDWLFGTYRAQPEAGHAAMTLGLAEFRDPKELRLDRMLTQPFRDDPPLKPEPHGPEAR